MVTKFHKDATGLDLHINKLHAETHISGGTDVIALATTSVAGLLSASDKTKLDAILSTGSGSIITSAERVYLNELTGGGYTTLHKHANMIVGTLSSGAFASRPSSPTAGDVYITTDTAEPNRKRFFICFIAGQWDEVTVITT